VSRYAEGTSVSVEKSRAEIESILTRYGANGFVSGWQENRAFVAFMKDGRQIRLSMTLPEKGERRFGRLARIRRYDEVLEYFRGATNYIAYIPIDGP
jgi:hypothetical protein